jgi:hypothetical protein
LRDKIARTLKYDDLMQYYLDHSDETEGAGMGLALVVILLKGEGIDPQLFRVKSTDHDTIARIEIPMGRNFKSIRDTKSRQEKTVSG